MEKFDENFVREALEELAEKLKKYTEPTTGVTNEVYKSIETVWEDIKNTVDNYVLRKKDKKD